MNTVTEFLKEHPYGPLIRKGFYILFVLLTALLIFHVVKRFFEHLRKRRERDKGVNTIVMLLDKVLRGIVFFVALLLILDRLGVNTNSILATAGIGTLIVGLGAQSLVKDFINGFFILTERQYVAGEYIKVGNLEGYVEDVGLRMTRLRNYNGEIQFVPNGMMQGVINTSRTSMRATATVVVSYEADIKRTMESLKSLVSLMEEEQQAILQAPIEFLGITASKERGMELTYRTFTKPEQQWTVERYLLEKALQKLQEEKIPLPGTYKEESNAVL